MKWLYGNDLWIYVVVRGKTYETFQRAKKNDVAEEEKKRVRWENDKIERKIENVLDNSGFWRFIYSLNRENRMKSFYLVFVLKHFHLLIEVFCHPNEKKRTEIIFLPAQSHIYYHHTTHARLFYFSVFSVCTFKKIMKLYRIV